MNKCFYLSTRKDRNAEAVPLMEALQARGWERTFDWANQGFSGPSEYSDLAVAEISGIRDADVLIVLLPGGYGTHVEIGAALALGKPVILHAPSRETLETPYACAFHYHPAVKLLISEPLDIAAVLAHLPKK
jgi:nucleoside 2-deoxyribosyltransferase